MTAARKAERRLLRAATLRSASFDAEARTVEVVWTTGAAVRRIDWLSGDEFDEVLSLEPGAVRLDRLNAGAPFLDTHNSFELGAVIGSVVPGSARIDGGKGLATIRLSGARADADTIGKIRDGVIRNISVGYLCHRWEETEVDGLTTRTVTDWEPLEISAVPVPADAGAQIRSHGRRSPVRQSQDRARTSTRVADIRRWARKANLVDLGEEHVLRGTSSDDFFHLIAARLTGQPITERATMNRIDKSRRDFAAGRAEAERLLGRKASRDEDDAKKKDDDADDHDERDNDGICPECGRPLDDDDPHEEDSRRASCSTHRSHCARQGAASASALFKRAGRR